ncbi:MAG: FliO/MopB family protein [Geminicoccaceae bacterium]
MASTEYLRFMVALALVLALIGICGWLAKRFRLGSMIGGSTGSGRLQMIETLALDGRQRLVLVRRDDREHLLLVGQDGGRIVEAGIEPQAAVSIPITPSPVRAKP